VLRWRFVLAKAISLAYHDIVEAGCTPEHTRRVAAAHYSLSRAQFRQHLESIAGSGETSVSTVAATPLAPAVVPVFLTFDDGAAGADTCAADELERRNWRGHFFITTDWIGQPGFLDAASIRELHRRGHVIGTHTRSHPARMSQLGAEELLAQWTESCSTLSGLVGQPIVAGSVADGYYSLRVGQAAARAGLKFLFNSEPTQTISEVDGCQILGRYAILAGTTPAEAGALARGKLQTRMLQATSWNAKKIAKSLAGEQYLNLRRWLLSGPRE
jgi:peptidoglycan/xylan/chitin deacetylase (PgdA/CDA1 family)